MGDEIKVKVLKFDASTNRVSLGLKQKILGEMSHADILRVLDWLERYLTLLTMAVLLR